MTIRPTTPVVLDPTLLNTMGEEERHWSSCCLKEFIIKTEKCELNCIYAVQKSGYNSLNNNTYTGTYFPIIYYSTFFAAGRVSSKQTIFCFGSNRNKSKLDLFRFYFGLFCQN